MISTGSQDHDIRHWLLARTMSGSVAQLQLESVLIFMDHAATKDCADDQDLSHHLRLY